MRTVRTQVDADQLGREPNRERGTISILAVMSLFVLAASIAVAGLASSAANLGHSAQARETTTAQFIAVAALNDALSEIRREADGADDTDIDGDARAEDRGSGFGALGMGDQPMQYKSSTGRVIGEYRTWVVNLAVDVANDAPVYVVRALVAVPSFAAVASNARGSTRFAAEARIKAKVNFLFAPNTGAISISGPVNSMALNNWNNGDLQINGGTYPSIVMTDQTTHDNFIDSIENNWDSGWGLDDNVTGSPMVTFNEGESDEFEAPISLQPDTAISAEMMNDYRVALRSYAEGLVKATASGGSKSIDYGSMPANVTVLHEHPDVKNGAGSGKPRIKQDLNLGNDPNQVILIDSSEFYQGGASLTDNHGRKLSGKGTIVIMHPIGSKTDNANGKQFDLDWEGDVIVLGYPDDKTSGVGENSSTDNLLYLSRADWNVTGNLIVLSAGTTEASLEMRGTGSDTANLTVNGSLLLFSEATGHEAELDVEHNANITVNGLLGVYGKRAEIENQDGGTGTSMIINGTMAIGMPDNVSTSTELQVEGNAQFNFDLDTVTAAVAGLAELQQNLTFQNEVPQSLDYSSLTFRTRTADWTALLAESAGSPPAGGAGPAGEEWGVDPTLIQNNAQ